VSEFLVDIVSADGNDGDTVTVEATDREAAARQAVTIEGWKAVAVDGVPL
jgi:hypothetical protein